MKRVYCIGEMLIDFICKDSTKDLSRGVNFEKKAGGAPANVAAAVSKLGGLSSFMGMVGDDPFGVFLEDTLREVNIDTSLLKRMGNTTLAFVSIDDNGERDFKFMRGADGDYFLRDEELNSLEEGSIIHFGSATGFLKGRLRETYYRLLDFARERGMFISFDPNYRDALIDDFEDIKKDYLRFMEHADLVKLSDDEARLITNIEDIEGSARELLKYGDFILCITLGAKGTLLATRELYEMVPSIEVKQVDSTGAGDAFVGGFLYRLSKVESLKNIIKDKHRLLDFVSYANRVGALTCTNYGAISSIPTGEEVDKLR